jgi:hypothetical protein
MFENKDPKKIHGSKEVEMTRMGYYMMKII